jgi:protein-tyrosine phosphatase
VRHESDPPLTDIHCHLLPGIDDGASDLECSLEMARMSVEQGTRTVIVTPHQLGNFCLNHGDQVRARTRDLQRELIAAGIDLELLPGADVRIEDGMIEAIDRGEVLTLGDYRRHVLLELPHELYFPLEGLLCALRSQGIVGILSHPERNAGLVRHPELLTALVDGGCLMQVTAGSLMGTFGPAAQNLAEQMFQQGLVHFVATDAHGARKRRPLMRRAFQRVTELAGRETAIAVCSDYPHRVARGRDVPVGRQPRPASGSWWQRITGRKAG